MTLDSLLSLARKHGTDEEFRRWIQRQPSAYSGTFSEYLESGEGRCVAAHIRRSADSGTGYKAEYSCIPLTFKEHLRQHQHGESALMPKDWWNRMREKYLRLWIEGA